MKHLNIIAYCLTGLFALTACESDRDDNPTIKQPTTFQLNISSSEVYDLEANSTIQWGCVAPDYGYSAPLTYSIQINKDDNWTEAEGDTPASYKTLETTYTSTTFDVKTEELNRSLILLNEWYDEATFPSTAEVYVRVQSTLSTTDAYKYYSETMKVNVKPYYTKVSTEPAKLYIVGDHQGWATDGTAPLIIASDDAGTTFSGYAQLNKEFKFMTTTSWNDPNYGGSNGTLEQGGDNITVSKPGFYQIDVNLSKMTYKLQTCTWGVVGDATPGGWDSDIQLTYNEESKALEAKATLSGGEIKFRQDGAWSISLGGSLDALVLNGGNIAVNAGTYTIRLYLSDGAYHAELIPEE